MKTTVRLTIDFEVSARRWSWFPFFEVKNYAKATYEGEMPLDELRAGDTLSLEVFNSMFKVAFIVREIQKTPPASRGELQALIELYARPYANSLSTSAARLRGDIRDRLFSNYGLRLDEDSCRIGSEPTYEYLPSRMGAEKSTIERLTFRV